MLTDAVNLRTPDMAFPGDWVFVCGVLLLIAAIFIRMYVWGGRSRRQAGHHSRWRTVHRASRMPERGGNYGHRTVSRRRPDRP